DLLDAEGRSDPRPGQRDVLVEYLSGTPGQLVAGGEQHGRLRVLVQTLLGGDLDGMSGPGGLVAVLDAVRGLALLALTLFEHQFAVAVGVLGQVLPEQPAELLGTYGGGAVLPGGGAVAEVRSEFHPHAPLVGGPLLVGRLPLGGHRSFITLVRLVGAGVRNAARIGGVVLLARDRFGLAGLFAPGAAGEQGEQGSRRQGGHSRPGAANGAGGRHRCLSGGPGTPGRAGCPRRT